MGFRVYRAFGESQCGYKEGSGFRNKRVSLRTRGFRFIGLLQDLGLVVSR